MTALQRLLTVIIAVIIAVFTGATIASATKTVSTPETRVGVAAISAPVFVGSRAPGNPARVGRIGCNYDGTMVGSCVATKAGVNPACKNSFAGETRVLMADGTAKEISEVKVGDKVLATDPVTGKTEPHEVVDLITGEGEKHLVDVEIRTKDGVRTIVATRGHPFWVEDTGVWLRADQLHDGDELRAPDGTEFSVVGSTEHIEFLKVHNLTIEGIHTYYVLAGNQPVLVHNLGGSGAQWPSDPSGMDNLTGVSGTPIPDGPSTPGRGKVVWNLPDGTKITYEQHPYHANAPDWHKDAHWHVDKPGEPPHQRRLLGDPFDVN